MGRHTFSGLDEMTSYDYRVRQTCTTGSISEWTEASFTTGLRPCLAPSVPSVRDVSFDQATIDWTSHNEQSVFHLRLNDGFADNVITVTSHPYTLTGLSPDVTYSVAVADSCTNNGTLSEYSPAAVFTTPECTQVTDVAVSDITATSAVVTWNGAIHNYLLEYGTDNFSAGTGTTIDDIQGETVTLSPLQPETEYSVYIRSKCGDETYSIWSDRVSFQTSAVGISQPTTLAPQILVHPNPAKGAVSIISSSIGGKAEVAIVDINGRTVAEYEIADLHSGSKIDISHLPAGSYFVRIVSPDTSTILKLVVRK